MRGPRRCGARSLTGLLAAPGRIATLVTVTDPEPSAGPEVPPLPARLADPRPVMAVGSAAWLVAVVVLAARALIDDGRGLGAPFATAVVGLALGAIGYGIFAWQRRTLRTGSGRGQRGISE